MWCSDTGLCWPFCFWRNKNQDWSGEKMNVRNRGFSMDYTETWLCFSFLLIVYFEQHYFYGETKEAMKNKKRLVCISLIRNTFIWCFSCSLNIFPFVCKLFDREGWRQYCKSYPTTNAPSYGPMHLLSVCMNGSLSNWYTMLHYTPQWGSMQVR